ncbi:unnamed protein product [Coregonus sp. 'balchen']|nr:unnamed protein product [Coregonus sp. 'balchen']
MYRRSGRLQTAKSENASIQKGKITKQGNKNKCQPLSKRQSGIQNQLVLEGVSNPCVLVKTPEKRVETACELSNFEDLRSGKKIVVQPSPLPLSWGCPEVWDKMLMKERKYIHSNNFTQLHPRIQPKMRSILLDWLLEVSEVYTLHRETFYLAQDYFDRFMLIQEDIDKDRLQLIGITSLFIAAKIEEMYPPKLHELAYVTDGACMEEEILQMELVILKALNWSLCPETVVVWLKLMIQMASLEDQPDCDILLPEFSQENYIQVTRLLDLCILNINSLDYQYRVLAAAALCHYLPYEVVEKVSGLTWDVLDGVTDWMAPFVDTVAVCGRAQLKDFIKVASEDRHNIQTHSSYLLMLEEARRRELEHQFLTPPNSTEKPMTH